jgi:hypothetical protein
MIIDSPVGRFPFEVTSIRIRSGQVRVEGAMGTWPTRVHVPIADLPRVLGLALPSGTSAGLAGSAMVVGLLAVARGRRRRRARSHSS